MYVDDLVVIAISIVDLRLLLQVALNYFESIDMPINIIKSKCARFGKRFSQPCSPISLSVGDIKWVAEFKYLGVTVVASKRFKCNFSESRCKFFGSFNAIYGRIGNKNCIVTLLSLFHSICVPALLFGAEAALNDRAEMTKLCYSYQGMG